MPFLVLIPKRPLTWTLSSVYFSSWRMKQWSQVATYARTDVSLETRSDVLLGQASANFLIILMPTLQVHTHRPELSGLFFAVGSATTSVGAVPLRSSTLPVPLPWWQ